MKKWSELRDEVRKDPERAARVEAAAAELRAELDPLFAYSGHGHDHRWCSQSCKDDDCQFGPCCVPS